MSQVNLSEMRLQEVRRVLESDYGKDAQATMIVRNAKGEIVLFISGGSAEEIETSIHEYRQQLTP